MQFQAPIFPNFAIKYNLNQAYYKNNQKLALLLEKHHLLPGNYSDLEKYNRREELKELLVRITELYASLEQGDDEAIREAYLAAMYRRDGNFYQFKLLSGVIIEAKIIGPDSYGCLVLEERSGKREHYAFQEIKYIL